MISRGRRCVECSSEKEALEKRVKELEEENLRLKLELQEFRERYWLGRKKKENGVAQDKEEPKKRGAPIGHPGWFRRKPKKIDHTEEVTLNRCPHCGFRKLTECEEPEDHVQEDIEIPRVIVTMYRRHFYWCKRCKDVVSGLGNGELLNSYIGPVAKSLAVWLKYDVKISDRDLKRMFSKLFNLNIVPASLAGFRSQLSRHTRDLYEQLLQRLRRSKQVHVDETGWKVDGIRHQLWSASNRFLSVFMIHKSRGLKALQALMGDSYRGKLSSDFYSVYVNFSAFIHQTCNVHLLRELKRILKNWEDDPVVQRYAQRLKALIQSALDLKKQFKRKQISKRAFERKRHQIVASLADFAFPHPDRKPLQRIAKRLSKFKDTLFPFLFHPGLEGHNNDAERQIRPNVLFRKITFGNRSLQGADNHSILMSFIQTAKLHDRSPPDVLKGLWTTSPEKHSLDSLGLKSN